MARHCIYQSSIQIIRIHSWHNCSRVFCSYQFKSTTFSIFKFNNCLRFYLSIFSLFTVLKTFFYFSNLLPFNFLNQIFKLSSHYRYYLFLFLQFIEVFSLPPLVFLKYNGIYLLHQPIMIMSVQSGGFIFMKLLPNIISVSLWTLAISSVTYLL